MKALLIGAILAAFSMNSFAGVVTELLTQEEIKFAIELSDKYDADFIVSGVCTKSTFTLVSTQDNMNEVDTFTFETKKGLANLTKEEVAKQKALEERLEVMAKMSAPGTFFKEIKITGASCGFSPNTWTAEFYR